MSRKKSKSRQAVPEEIRAEGSGPEDVGAPAEEVVETVDAEPEAPSNKRRSKKSEDSVAMDDVVEAVDPKAVEAVEAVEAEPAPVAKKRRGKKLAAGTVSETDELVVDEVVADEVEAELAAEDVPAELAPDEVAEALVAEAVVDELDAELRADGEQPEGDDVVGEPITDEATVEAALMPGSLSPVQLRHLIEALIFATDKPVTLQRLRQLTRVSDVARIEAALAELQEDYKDRGIALHSVSGGWQFRTNTAFSTWVQQLIQGRPVRLSRAQLETLAIVAYRQPITRPEIDDIRGVDSSATLRLLLDRSLIRVLGKREEVGRPTLYGTTKEFLDFFSLSDLRELPTLREYSELTAESRQVMSNRLGVPLDENGELVEPEEELVADEDGMTSESVETIDSILAEHAAAEARLDVGALADAAMSGGSIDRISDVVDDVEVSMSGEMGNYEGGRPASEARSYIDAIRQSALVDESDDETSAAPHVGHESESDELVASTDDAPHVGHESDELIAAPDETSAAPESDELVASTDDEMTAAPHVGHESNELSDNVELNASTDDAPHVGHESESDELVASTDEAVSAAPHVGHESESDELVAPTDEEMSAAPHVGHESNELSDNAELNASTDDAPHVGHESESNELVAPTDEEMSAVGHESNELSDNAELNASTDDAPHVGHESESDELVASTDEEMSAAPHVGHESDELSDNAELNASTDDAPHVGHESDEQLVPHVGHESDTADSEEPATDDDPESIGN